MSYIRSTLHISGRSLYIVQRYVPQSKYLQTPSPRSRNEYISFLRMLRQHDPHLSHTNKLHIHLPLPYCTVLTMNAEIQGLFTFPLILYLYNYITRLMFFQVLMTYNLTYQRDPYAKTTPVDIEDNIFACPHHSGNPQHYLVFQRRISLHEITVTVTADYRFCLYFLSAEGAFSGRHLSLHFPVFPYL